MLQIAWFPLFITFYGIAGIVCAVGAFFVAQRKFRDRESWAFSCFFLPPLFFLLLWLGPSRYTGQHRARPVDEDSDDEDDGDGVARNAATRNLPM
jgi:hypothetical protein